VGCDGVCIEPETDDSYCGATDFCEGSDQGDECVDGEQCVDGSCRAPNGAPCSAGVDCLSGACITWYADLDGDGFGASDDSTSTCGASPPGASWVTNNLDCCDVSTDPADAAAANPGFSTGTVALGRIDGAQGCAEPYDWNCDGVVTQEVDSAVPCETFTTAGTCPIGVFTEGFVPECGEQSLFLECEWSEGQCNTMFGGPFTQRCY
jgi:hypothetical protein